MWLGLKLDTKRVQRSEWGVLRNTAELPDPEGCWGRCSFPSWAPTTCPGGCSPAPPRPHPTCSTGTQAPRPSGAAELSARLETSLCCRTGAGGGRWERGREVLWFRISLRSGRLGLEL